MESDVVASSEGQPGRPRGPAAADGVYRALLAGIADGSHPVNVKLPSEHDLAARFGVSRPVVRAALDRLRRDNAIVSRQGAGSFVTARTLAPALGFAPVDSIADIQRCYEYRLTLEPDAARHAAARRDDAALARIAAALDRLALATRQGQYRDDVDFAFHLAVAEASNNHYYAASFTALQSHIAVGMRIAGLSLLGPEPGLQDVLGEHRGIFAAVRDRDGAAAHRRMADHIGLSRDRLFEGRALDLSLEGGPGGMRRTGAPDGDVPGG